MDVINYKCSSCGAPLVFDGGSQMLVCTACSSSFDLDESSDGNNIINYECPSCGAEILANKTIASTRCPYCESTTILSKKLDNEYKPDYIIPFSIGEEEAINKLKEYCSKKQFIPSEFKSESKFKHIKGVYVPFWLWSYDIELEGRYKAEDIKEWSDNAYKYKKTEYYELYRKGNVKFKRIPVNGANKFDDDLMENIGPFMYSGLKDFKTIYLSGYLSEIYDIDAESSEKKVRKCVKDSIKKSLKDTISDNYTNVEETDNYVNFINSKYEYSLLPVWIVDTEYEGKTYTIAVNGQTGKVSGKLPVCNKTFGGFFLKLSAVLFIIFLLVLFLGGK